MIKTIIFDFGDVFIDLDKSATIKELSKLGISQLSNKSLALNDLYETGGVSSGTFIDHYNSLIPHATEKQIINAWNAILIRFPKHRMDFIKQLASENVFKLILLSNTNELHINWVKKHINFYPAFKECFDSFYLSHEVHLRKPNIDIFKFVLNQHHIDPTETLFIDDTPANTDAAASIGIHVWNNDPDKEDITDLFTIKSDIF